MEAVGITATALGAVLLLLFFILLLVSLPDIARYMRIRRM